MTEEQFSSSGAICDLSISANIIVHMRGESQQKHDRGIMPLMKMKKKRQVNDDDITKWGVTVEVCVATCEAAHQKCKINRCDCSPEDNDRVAGCINTDCGSEPSQAWRGQLVAECPLAFAYGRPSSVTSARSTSSQAPSSSDITPTTTSTIRSSSSSSVFVPQEVSSSYSEEPAPPPPPSTFASPTQSRESSSTERASGDSSTTSQTSRTISETTASSNTSSSTSSSSISRSETRTTDLSSFSSNPALNSSKESTPLNAGVIAGIALGGLVLIALLLAICYRCCWHDRRKPARTLQISSPGPPAGPSGASPPWVSHGNDPIYVSGDVLAEKYLQYASHPGAAMSHHTYFSEMTTERPSNDGLTTRSPTLPKYASPRRILDSDESQSDIFLSSQSMIWSPRSMPRTVSIDVNEHMEQHLDEARAQSTRANSIDLNWVHGDEENKPAPTWGPPRRRPSTRSKRSVTSRGTRGRSTAAHSIYSSRSGSTAAYTYRSGSTMPSGSLTRSSSRLLPKPPPSPLSSGRPTLVSI